MVVRPVEPTSPSEDPEKWRGEELPGEQEKPPLERPSGQLEDGAPRGHVALRPTHSGLLDGN